jgi:type I restriction enzyme S subunit
VVERLDAAFEKIDRAIELTEKNITETNLMKSSLLTNAFNVSYSKTVKLGDVCEIYAGGDIPKLNFSKTKTDKFTVPVFSNGERNQGMQGYTNIARVNEPSVTISARGTIGYSVIRKEPFYPAVRLLVVTPRDNTVVLQYLHYAITMIDFKNTGVSIPQLTVPMLKDYRIPIVSLEEQRRVVERLDAVFEKIDATVELRNKKLMKLNELKQSALTQAFSGSGVK